MYRKCPLLALSALSLAACSIGRPMPQATTYLVDLPGDSAVPFETRLPIALRMGDVRIATPYAGSALVYRLDDVRYVSDPYHAFVAEPGGMLGSRMAAWLDHTGSFNTVAQPGSPQSAAYVLHATVTELYGDFREGRVPAAVVAVQFALIAQVSARRNVIYERTIARRVNLPNASPDSLVRGYGTALAEILSQLADELPAQITRYPTYRVPAEAGELR
jgi:cholesterol transport system auxiliary component